MMSPSPSDQLASSLRPDGDKLAQLHPMLHGGHIPGTWTVPAWTKISAFEVFGDYAPMKGFRLVIAVGPDPLSLGRALESRAQTAEWLDPDLARANVRAGLGLLRAGVGAFAYANPEQTLLLVGETQGRDPGQVAGLQARLASMYSARLSLLCGQEMGAQARIYEFPDLTVVRRALSRLVEDVEETTPLRSSVWLGAQLRGRGRPFHPSMIETLEEQTSLLRSHGIDMDALPGWWWRGLAGQLSQTGELQVVDELPHGDSFGELVVG